jgi:hypothetical protein
MPVLLARRKPDDITGTDFLDRAAIALRAAEPGDDDQRLPEWMSVPGCTRAGLKGYA